MNFADQPNPNSRATQHRTPDHAVAPMPAEDITCKALIDSLMAYLDGELDARQSAAIARHLAVCPSCVNYANSYRAVLRAASAAFDQRSDAADHAAPELVADILSRFQKQRPGDPDPR
jgi:anti-sigma factor RsiW